MGIMYFILIRGRNCEKYLKTCLKSLQAQTYQNWRAMVVLDAPEDDSYQIALPYEGNKIYIHLNESHKGLCHNMWHGINLIKDTIYPKPEDVICILDADDSLDPHALEIVNKHYVRKECLVTHGSYIKMSKGRKTKVSKPNEFGVKIRRSRWRSSHLKSFKVKLWEHFPRRYFQDDKGYWGAAASDLALMFTIIELAGLKSVRHISKPIYFWKDNTKFKTDGKKQRKWEKILRGKKHWRLYFEFIVGWTMGRRGRLGLGRMDTISPVY